MKLLCLKKKDFIERLDSPWSRSNNGNAYIHVRVHEPMRGLPVTSAYAISLYRVYTVFVRKSKRDLIDP